MEKLTLKLKDLACPDCAQKIGQVLERSNGINQVKISYATGKARIEYEPELIDREEIVAIIEKIGYKVVV